MKRNLLLVICICFSKTGYLYAQWTEKDSIWLQHILSGKEEIRLNPEAIRAIEEGSLLNTDREAPAQNMQLSNPVKLSITKDFKEYIRPKSGEKEIDPYSMHPAVFMRYGLDKPMPANKTKAFVVSPNIRREATRPSGTSFDDGLKYLFSPAARAKMRNKERAKAWKTYNRFP